MKYIRGIAVIASFFIQKDIIYTFLPSLSINTYQIHIFVQLSFHCFLNKSQSCKRVRFRFNLYKQTHISISNSLTLVQTMVCHLFMTKTVYGPVLPDCWLDHLEQISVISLINIVYGNSCKEMNLKMSSTWQICVSPLKHICYHLGFLIITWSMEAYQIDSFHFL